MKLRVLVDNNTYIDRYYLGEPAVSYYIECDGIRLLFDAGYSDVFLKNAEALGIDLGLVTHLVFSHGHNDHTRGLKFMKERLELSGMEVIAHPSCFDEKVFGEESIGAPYSAADMAGICRYRPCGGPCNISERLVFLGEIPDAVDFETRNAIGRTRIRGKWQDDYVRDDSALVYRGEEGIFIITGCSHSGICNIVQYAQAVCGQQRVLGIIGGFHLFEADERLVRTIDYLKCCGAEQIYPCHCVSLRAKARMMEALNVKEVGVGMELCLDGQAAH